MKVNICWVDWKGDKIIDRLMRELSERTGWGLSDRPDERADLNYFGLYIDFAQRFSDWHRTRLAAYFSHFEAGTPYKEFWWKTAEPLIDIKTVTAAQYGSLLTGAVVKVVPPIDQRFEIRERKPNERPVIGVSGFVAPGGRKGEKLIARLAGDLEGQAEIVASGEGWPVRKVNHGLDGLPAFYNSLDLYLCTSTIEGIPMPPLEALACGVPVVVPWHVGMLDDLPDELGIYRFEPGNYDNLLDVVRSALLLSHDVTPERRQALASAVSGYTPEAWAKSHIEGFKGALSQKQDAAPKKRQHLAATSSDRHGRRGVYYVAYGGPARDCAKGAIDSFKKFLPDTPVALVSDQPLGVEDVFIQHADEDIGGRAAKVQIYDLAPADWQYVCYLDADTEIIAAETLLWQIVEDGWDMVICRNPGRFHVAREMRRSDNGDECEQTFQALGTDELIQLNGGVFAFQRNERTKAFFSAWHQEWRRWGKRDQGALLRALFANPVKLLVLGVEWNLITRYDAPERAAWLKHYPMTARRWRGIVDHPLTSPEAWQVVADFERSQK